MFWLFKKSQYNVFIMKFIYAKALTMLNVRLKKCKFHKIGTTNKL